MSQSRPLTLRILDEVNCVFVGLTPDHLGYLAEEYAIYAANYYFNPKYKLGQWDGKIRFFHKTGKTYVNLLGDILPKVIGLGYKIKVDDLRTVKRIRPLDINEDFFSGVINPMTDEPWKVRDYQVELVNTLFEAGSGIAIAGTGAGKTSMCAALALSYEREANFRSLIIVPDKNLTLQTRENYAFFGLDVGEYSGTHKDFDHMHVVTIWKCLKNNPTLIQDFNVVIVDECHGLRGNVLSKLLNEYGKNIPYRFGVTGTLPKEESDKLAAIVAVGNVQYTVPAHQLIDEGHLAEIETDIYQTEIELRDQYNGYLEEHKYLAEHSSPNGEPLAFAKPVTYTQFVDGYFTDWPAEKAFLQQEPTRIKWLVNYLTKKKNEGNTLVLVDGVNFGKKLAGMIPGAVFLYGRSKMDERKKVFDSFKTQDNILLIATVQIASTGLDIPRIFNLVCIDIGKSFVRVIQSIGRSLRKAKDKNKAHYSDICSNLKYSKRHLRERCKYYKEAKYKFRKHLVDLTAVNEYGHSAVE